MTTPKLILISHVLCPYVQRAAIVLSEKGAHFERRDVDLANKPQWLLDHSPLGKTPVLLVDGEAIFESAVICEFLEETLLPTLHPIAPLERARHRAWMAFGSSMLDTIGRFYNAQDSETLAMQAGHIRSRLEQLEAALAEGPFFGGPAFGLVDATFGPIFRYFDVFDEMVDFRSFEGLSKGDAEQVPVEARARLRDGMQGANRSDTRRYHEDLQRRRPPAGGMRAPCGTWSALPKVKAWRAALALRPSVRDAVHPRYPVLLQDFLLARKSELARIAARMPSQSGMDSPIPSPTPGRAVA